MLAGHDTVANAPDPLEPVHTCLPCRDMLAGLGTGACAARFAGGRGARAVSHSIVAAALESGRRALTEIESKALLAERGIGVPRYRLVNGAEQATSAVAGLDGPFVVKVVSRDILHKSDAGGVALGLADGTEVTGAIREMARKTAIADARVDGYLVEEMVPPGLEVVVGAVRDPQFGPMVMIGLGGIFVEVLGDVSFRLCPIAQSEAAAMLDELKGVALLDGARGAEPVSRRAIVDVLLAIGGKNGLMLREDGIAEVDVNPLIVAPDGAVAVDGRVILRRRDDAEALVKRSRDDLPTLERFRPLFRPGTVAVVGASATKPTIGNTFIRRMQAFGYPGVIYPIHPKATHIEGLPSYPSLGETPEPIDYAYVAIGAERVPDLLATAAGNVAFAQVITSGFREEGNPALEDRLVASARGARMRLVGPNCLGTYSPRGRSLTFPIDAPAEPGRIGIVTQSGGLGTDIVKRGQWKGLGLSALVTVGNCADVGPADLVEFYLADDGTDAIGLYLEDIGDGRRFFDLMRGAERPKPVVLLRGGRSDLGRAAAMSHTGALASDGRAWQALAAQAPVALVDTVDEFLDVLIALQQLTLRPKRPTGSVALFGNGGGTGVLATDFFAEHGLAVHPFEGEAKEALLALGLPPGTSVANPVDTPVITLQTGEGRIANEILDIIYRYARPDAVVMHLNLASFVGRAGVDPVDNLIQAAVRIGRTYPGQAHFALVLRVDGSPELDDAKRRYCTQARDAGIPVYDELPQAARALAAVAHLERALGRMVSRVCGDDGTNAESVIRA